jgi:hypothetical protein
MIIAPIQGEKRNMNQTARCRLTSTSLVTLQLPKKAFLENASVINGWLAREGVRPHPETEHSPRKETNRLCSNSTEIRQGAEQGECLWQAASSAEDWGRRSAPAWRCPPSNWSGKTEITDAVVGPPGFRAILLYSSWFAKDLFFVFIAIARIAAWTRRR